MQKYLTLLFSLIYVINLYSQDEVFPLVQNQFIPYFIPRKSTKKNILIKMQPSKLPFVDDFSTNNTPPIQPNLSTASTFYLIGNCINSNRFIADSQRFNTSTAYRYTCNPANGSVDSTPINQAEIRENNPNNCKIILNTNTSLFPSYYRYQFDNTCKIIDSILIFDTTILAALIYEIPQTNLKWVDNYAYINRHFAKLPPTLGVATLDGLNQYGRPYNTIPNSQGFADYLTSIPIDLSGLMPLDSVYLSFYVQPQGLGDFPDRKDSLLVQMIDTAGKWITVWGINHSSGRILDSNLQFKQYFIPIPQQIRPSDPYFFHAQFQFRFVGLASNSGHNDHWHIDYVRMDKKRSPADSLTKQSAFQEDLPNPLKNYTMLPYKQYTGFSDFIDTLNAFHNILDPDESATTDYFVNVRNQNTNTLLFSDSKPFITKPNFKISYPILNLNFPTSMADSTWIDIKYFTTQADDILENDTARRRLLFHNEIAYDDGSAEMAYGLQGSGLKKFAIKYKIPNPDTLAAIKVFFSNIDDNVSDLFFNFEVWENIDVRKNSEKSLQKIVNCKPIYYDSLNKFVVFGLNQPLAVKDSFYIGWTQIDERNLQIGYDRNSTLGLPNVLIYTDNLWKLSNVIIPGSPMIRAILDGRKEFFNPCNSVSIESKTANNYSELIPYPNPFQNKFYIKGIDKPTEYVIYNLLGEKIIQSSYQPNTPILLENIPNGWYILNILDTETPKSLKIFKNEANKY